MNNHMNEQMNGKIKTLILTYWLQTTGRQTIPSPFPPSTLPHPAIGVGLLGCEEKHSWIGREAVRKREDSESNSMSSWGRSWRKSKWPPYFLQVFNKPGEPVPRRLGGGNQGYILHGPSGVHSLVGKWANRQGHLRGEAGRVCPLPCHLHLGDPGQVA